MRGLREDSVRLKHIHFHSGQESQFREESGDMCGLWKPTTWKKVFLKVNQVFLTIGLFLC